jgi:hypothetical protein
MITSTSSRKSKKTSKDKNSVSSSEVSIKRSRSIPDEEVIREKAREIYYQRIDRGEDGTPERDWLEAEAFLCESEV